MDYELTLFDRIEVIKSANSKYDLEHNAYLSFSGGKDSTILHHLLDMALPNNQIPRVFIDTGIEYQMIREFVYNLAKKDKRVVIIKPSKPIISMLQKVGYPFKSKEHSLYLQQYQKNGISKTVNRYLNPSEDREKFGCVKVLRYQFTPSFKLKVSNRCCYELKKKPVQEWAKKNNKSMTITGMRAEEGGNRRKLGCITDNGTRFHPLIKVDDDWENQFVKELETMRGGHILCELYYPPYNFKRTGCKGCPYAIDLSQQLEVMARYLPAEREQCELIWQPVYEEYRRLGYRLKKVEEIKLF